MGSGLLSQMLCNSVFYVLTLHQDTSFVSTYTINFLFETLLV